ncbi:MAG: succinyldiaminopimelate transaminase [Burkholderiales bacterium]|jgi:N-succinyldiaminopimelate aminotransferase|nr:succinyldiaminopimelate transaminase [Burkholderiales bacterium]
MNPDLARLQPYPFERLRQLLAGNTPPSSLSPINLSIGEPKHATPQLIFEALTAALPTLASYPLTLGTEALRESIAAWLARRYALPKVDPASQVIPVAGSREALFAFAQTVVDRTRAARVVMPNPFYQIYEGAALLAGAEPLFLPCTPENGLRMDFGSVDAATWAQVQLVYVCSPGNPHGRVMRLDEWRELFALADRHGFVIASDECYAEIYLDETAPPLGGLQAAVSLGRPGFERLVAFGSLSKRSNAPGLRSGFVAGDAAVLKKFLLYRTYHGTALGPAVQAASVAAWRDEAHVVENRRKYAAKFRLATPIVQQVLRTEMPEAAFYLWARTPIDDAEFARRLHARCNVTVLPGSFLSRTSGGLNPGAGFVRIALVAEEAEVIEAARRIAEFGRSL